MSWIMLVRALGASALAFAIAVVALPSATGHSSQTGSSPAAGAVLDAAPSSVEVTFDTPLMDVGAALVVRSADGTVISEAPEVTRTAIRVAVAADAQPGAYTVAYRVVSQDGHPITSTFGYTVAGNAPVTASATPAPTAWTSDAAASTAASPAAASPDESSSGPPYALIAVGLLALTLIGVGAIALRR